MIAFYRKNIFNSKIKLLPTVSLLVYLIWIGFNEPMPLYEVEENIKLAMNYFIFIICIKNYLKFSRMLFTTSLAFLSQFLWNHLNGSDHDIGWILTWAIYSVNLFNSILIVKGQKSEVAFFSIFTFLIQYGLANPLVDIMDLMFFSIILVTLVFGPTIF